MVRCRNPDEVEVLLAQHSPNGLTEADVVELLALDRVEARLALRRLWRERKLRCARPGVFVAAGDRPALSPQRHGVATER